MVKIVLQHVFRLFKAVFIFDFFLVGDFSLDLSLSRVPSFLV